MLLTELISEPGEVIPYQYNQIQSPEFDAIIDSFLTQAPTVPHPVIIHMAGIPGAGKTTFYHSRPWPQHIFIAFDDIMEDISDYNSDLLELGTAGAFGKWELTARIIGYELLRRAVSAKKNIFFDNGGSSQAHLHLLQNIKKFGYTSEMYYISCSLDTAIARAIAREKEINRHIPVETIKERYIKTLNNIKEYKKIVDRFYHFDSTESGFIEQSA